VVGQPVDDVLRDDDELTVAAAAREAELVTIFKEATRLETDFWEMGWRAGLRELIHRTLHVPLVPS
jgi:thiaminase